MIQIDFNKDIVTANGKEYSLSSPEAFALISKAWLRCGWDNKYVYTFSWFGRPIIQLPEDIVRLQELIFRIQPDVIIETGIAHGGSLIFYACLCKAIGKGRIIGIDVEIRPYNRQALEKHFLYSYITLIEGNSIDTTIISQVSALVKANETVLIFLDSCHCYEHVLCELQAYSPLVTQDSYIVVMDGIMEELVGAPRTKPEWAWDNPKRAALDFVKTHPDFIIEEPALLFNEGTAHKVTYSPSGYIKRVHYNR